MCIMTLFSDNIIMSDKVLLAYNPNDLFYYKVKNELSKCDSSGLTFYESCNHPNDYDDSGLACTAVELCKNQNYAIWIDQLKSRQLGAMERYNNSNEYYNYYYLNMANLGRIVAAILYLYKM